MHGGGHYSSKAAYFNEYVECADYQVTAGHRKILSAPEESALERNFEQSKCRGVVIRSGNDDNIHKAIKYGIWTTTYRNKHKLDQYWRDCLERKVDTYMFFSRSQERSLRGRRQTGERLPRRNVSVLVVKPTRQIQGALSQLSGSTSRTSGTATSKGSRTSLTTTS